MRERLPRSFPGTTFAFLPADIVTQILNFGLPAPIDVQVVGPNFDANRAYADELLAKIAHVTGVADARIQQAFNTPTFNVDVDRMRAAQRSGSASATSRRTFRTRWRAASSRADLLAQSEERRLLSDRRPDPAVLGELAVLAREHSRLARSDKQILGGVRLDQARGQQRSRVALRRAAGRRHLRDQQRARPRRRFRRHSDNSGRDREGRAEGLDRGDARRDPDDDLRLSASCLSASRWPSCSSTC